MTKSWESPKKGIYKKFGNKKYIYNHSVSSKREVNDFRKELKELRNHHDFKKKYLMRVIQKKNKYDIYIYLKKGGRNKNGKTCKKEI